MTGQQRLLSADAVDAARAAELRRVKAVAAGVLVACLVVLVFAKIMEPRHVAFGFLAAFAEAAAIGGLADWYAVVALFRRPLGLPIPHTAIIPANQQQDRGKTRRIHRAQLPRCRAGRGKAAQRRLRIVRRRLARRRTSEAAELARFVVKLLPDAVDAAENSGLRELPRAADRRPPAGARSRAARRRHVALVRARRAAIARCSTTCWLRSTSRSTSRRCWRRSAKKSATSCRPSCASIAPMPT